MPSVGGASVGGGPSAGRVFRNVTAAAELLARNPPLSAAQVADRLDLPRSTAYRLLEGLEAAGWAEFVDNGRVRLTLEWLNLADLVVEGMSEWRGIRRTIQSVSEQTGLTTFFSIPRDGEALCVAWAQGQALDMLELRPGRALPLNAGASGRCLLVETADMFIESEGTPLTPFTKYTITDMAALRVDADLTRSQGYVHSDEDVTLGIGAIGVPIRSANRVGCISVGGIAGGIRRDRDEIVKTLNQAAHGFAMKQS